MTLFLFPFLSALKCLGATPNDSPVFVLLGRRGTDGFNPNMSLDLVFCTWLFRLSTSTCLSEGWNSGILMCWLSLFMHFRPEAVVQSQQDVPCRQHC